jgi:mevalonate kinase
MKSSRFSDVFYAGSKTFLAGEYSVLFGGSAVVLVTPPEFQLQVEKGKTNLTGIDRESPACLFYRSHDFSDLSIKFCDPHGGSGGFGASSGQFTMLYKLYLRLTGQKFSIDSFLGEYKKCLPFSVGVAPSGADCLSQYFNRHIFFNSLNRSVEPVDWNFPRLDFFVFKTGRKTLTHVHLRELSPMDVGELENSVLNLKKSFGNGDEELLIASLGIFFNLLKERKLVLDQTVEIVDRLLKIKGVRSAKGCGALGADSVIVIFEKSAKDVLLREAEALHLSVVPR